MKRALPILLAGLYVALFTAGLALAVPRPPRPAAPEEFAPDIEPVDALLRAAAVHAPRHFEGLTIFPVTLSARRFHPQIQTLDEALFAGTLSISELDASQPNRVLAHNSSDRAVFLMAGEALHKAKQDRMVAEDILLPPHSTTQLPVWCVERGRWSGTKAFGSAGYMAPSSLRLRALTSKNQMEVWESVAELQEAAEAPSGSLATVIQSAAVRKEIAPFKEKFRDLPHMQPGACGVIVARGGEWLAADIFSDPDLFRRLWPKLLDSYLVEIVPQRPRHKETMTVREAEKFLGQLYWANRIQIPTAGLGSRQELQAPSVLGTALVYRSSVVHLEEFPVASPRPHPFISPAPMPR